MGFSVDRKAVEERRATHRAQAGKTTALRFVRRIPRRIAIAAATPDPIAVTKPCLACRARPVAAGEIAFGQCAVRIRSRHDVVRHADTLTVFVIAERALRRAWRSMKILNRSRDGFAIGVHPRSVADAIFRVNCAAAAIACAEIRAPLPFRSDRLGELLTMRIRSGEAADAAAAPGLPAGDEEAQVGAVKGR